MQSVSSERFASVTGSPFLAGAHSRYFCTKSPASLHQCRRRQAPLLRAEQGAVTTDETAVSGIEKSGNSFSALKDIEAIQEILPHRFPFLLLDRVVEYVPQKYAVGYKNVTANDNFFTGHFPERKIMPGVLQVEAMAQLGGIVMMDPEDQTAKKNFFFGGIDGCKFRRPVVPGDTLMMRVELTKFNPRFGIAKMSAKAYIGKALCCEAELTLVMGK
ncbi:beta-hydroxyacyl-dehydratase FabZ [Coccomyxa subellipsoidea C-169]|uniref:3-hydroxyacyl-[acyl-carrier-protein] dehydratase n=1 Tax=Coccomyxa subellipsoidea (strain C-169) TaxID=574566 RepID=I0YWZ4_COCSC|nr:beta-hydroxyacyl-dehydratase FabZ [Coccomyxa subellipsoidea C-169]EIE22913.1 beta-hydroxyacyl-dehydratase FabZ [Coccomyxa subellipsoidea C-169]|eukprot:XP_005647457.1 beta-hydroxyacyl-dehydratase FabZ [Coccomyxa subellipsoidea C-169]